jgi:outer membrane murein-binding lipoprotein Lpp
MEAVLIGTFLVAVLGLSELRALRAEKRFDVVLAGLKEVRRQVGQSNARVDRLIGQLKALGAAQGALSGGQKAVEESVEALLAECKRTTTNVDQILKEYQINGVPMGLIRKPGMSAELEGADFMEGL